MPWKVECSEFVQWAQAYDGPCFHAVLCDPPYGLEFMGKDWDRFDKSTSHHSFSRSGNNAPRFGCWTRTADEKGIAKLREHWDRYQAWTTEWGSALIPLLHPGALVFCFGGTRTWHRLACGMEAAGFELWDTLMWLHGQGFPKAQAIDKLIDRGSNIPREKIGEVVRGDVERAKLSGVTMAAAEANKNNKSIWGYGTEEITRPSSLSVPWSGHKTAALKPSWEPILCFKAPTQGKTYAELALEYGSGCLNVDGGRVAAQDSQLAEKYASVRNAPPRNNKIYGSDTRARAELPTVPHQSGRYPANLVLDEQAGEMLDEQAGILKSGRLTPEQQVKGGYAGTKNCYGKAKHGGVSFYEENKGGPSRFFYCAKASRKEREAGLLGKVPCRGKIDKAGTECGGIDTETHLNADGQEVACSRNIHPTVKPVSLIQWLATLLLPPDSVKPRRLLVPFAGSGSEMLGAAQAGWDEVVGIEKEKEYVEIARARLSNLEEKEEEEFPLFVSKGGEGNDEVRHRNA